MKYKIYRRKKKLKGKVTYQKRDPYVFNPSYHKREDVIDVSKLSIYNKDMTNNILSAKYIRRYKNILKMIYLLFRDEFPSDDGYPVVLGEIEKLRCLILDKYHKYLSQENEKLFLDELSYIENEVRNRLLEEVFMRHSFTDQNDFIR